MSAWADVVMPTVGRPSLRDLLGALEAGHGPRLGRIVVVDDRREPGPPLPVAASSRAAREMVVVRGRAAGPAAARNLGWRIARAPWVAFLDDDVIPSPAWRADLASDLSALDDDVAGSQGAIRVPRPSGRRPTDAERRVIGLEGAAWATADMAYRRDVLVAVGGFDERFPRAYREDADLALRAMAAGHRLVRGARRVTHPISPARPAASLRAQAGNADDVLMRAINGRGWRRRAGAPTGRRAGHLATSALAALAALSFARGDRRAAAIAAAGWGLATGELALARILPGPRTAGETALMAATSAALPFAATWHTARGLAARRRLLRDRVRAPRPHRASRPPSAVLFDRDGTLVEDVPYNGDPSRVRPMPGAAEALARLRDAGIPTAVVSNQSGVARGLLSMDQVAAVNHRIDRALGGLGPWLVCPHGPADGCRCRKPGPGLVEEAARRLGVDPRDCVVVGDIGADVEAAARAGARAILVPTGVTRRAEVAEAPLVAPDLVAAVAMLVEDGS